MKTLLTPEAMRVFVSAWLATASPSRLARMRKEVERKYERTVTQAEDADPAQRTAHERMLLELARAERKAQKRRAKQVTGA